MEDDKAALPWGNTNSQLHSHEDCYLVSVFMYDRGKRADAAKRAEAIRRILEATARELWDQ